VNLSLFSIDHNRENQITRIGAWDVNVLKKKMGTRTKAQFPRQI